MKKVLTYACWKTSAADFLIVILQRRDNIRDNII